MLLLMNHIKQRKLVFKNYHSIGTNESHISLQAYELFVKVAESISKQISKLKADQIMQIINSCFSNELKNHSIVEIISTEFVKQGKSLALQQLAKGFFKITLLGHRSKILAKYVFEQFSKQYHSLSKQYKEEDTFLLPTESQQQSSGFAPNFKLIHLQ